MLLARSLDQPAPPSGRATPGPFRNPLSAAAQALTDCPQLLWAVLFAVGAVFQPYAGLVHDAVLYAAQTVNRAEPGRLAGDLFFKYGSQDQFSLFSRLAAPVVRGLGLDAGFLALFLIGNGVFLWAAVRLVRAVVPDPVAGVAGLVYIAVTPIPFAGMSTLHANEPFLTPRLLANGLVLIGLERLVRGRPWQALGWMLGGMAFHPLMAVGGAALAALFSARQTCGPRTVWAGLGLAGTVAGYLLLNRTAGVWVFGYVDPDWYEMVRQANPFNIPSEWMAVDWVRVAVAAGVWAAAGVRHPDRSTRAVVLAAGVVGLVGAAAADTTRYLPYSLILKGQPYRQLWLLQFLAVPLGIWLAAEWWRSGRPADRLASAVTLVAVVWFPWNWTPFVFWVIAGVAAATLVGVRGLGRVPKRPDWLAATLLSSRVAVAVVWTVLAAVAATTDPRLLGRPELLDWVRLPAGLGGGWINWLVALAATAVAVRWAASRPVRAAGLVMLAAGVHAAFGLVPTAQWYLRAYRPQVLDAGFVREVVGAGRVRPAPTVYWATDRAGTVWFEVGADAYFEYAQIGGNLFNRANAVEVHRRAGVVAPFERYTYYRDRDRLDDRVRQVVRDLFHGDPADRPPGRADLDRLAADPAVDWVVLEQDFPDAGPVTNGRVYVYDARRLRAGVGE